MLTHGGRHTKPWYQKPNECVCACVHRCVLRACEREREREEGEANEPGRGGRAEPGVRWRGAWREHTAFN